MAGACSVDNNSNNNVSLQSFYPQLNNKIIRQAGIAIRASGARPPVDQFKFLSLLTPNSYLLKSHLVPC